MGLLDIYDKQYKKLLIIPFAMLLIAIIAIGTQMAQTGDFVNKGVSIKGGITMTLPEKTSDALQLQGQIRSAFPDSDVSVRDLKAAGTKIGLVIDASDVSSEDLIKEVEKTVGELTEDDYAVEEIGSALGDAFFKQTLVAILIAFLFMGIVVFFYFRTLAPSAAIILAAASDVIVTLAIFNFMGYKLSSAGIAAFLMLIGYSVDSDILLSTRVLKRKEGTVFERVLSACKTGLLMSGTTLAAVTIGLIFAESAVLQQIMTILLIGLLVDIINTWIQNVGILRYHMEKKHGQA